MKNSKIITFGLGKSSAELREVAPGIRILLPVVAENQFVGDGLNELDLLYYAFSSHFEKPRRRRLTSDGRKTHQRAGRGGRGDTALTLAS